MTMVPRDPRFDTDSDPRFDLLLDALDPHRASRGSPVFHREPGIIQSTARGDRMMDITTALFNSRVIMLGTEVNDTVANSIVGQLLCLEADDYEAPITLYVNSPGGSVTAGNAIIDCMEFIAPQVHTVGFGMIASMGAWILAAGQKGCRSSLPGARIMIHQPLGGAGGQATDIEIHATQILLTRKLMYEKLATYTGQPLEKIANDCERDYYMRADEALAYGLIDEVMKSRKGEHRKK
jgi:ATP-dependent Clp protease protease subunit